MCVCPLCLENLFGEDLHITFCSHAFHSSCLKSCMVYHSKCPVCRRDLIGKNGSEIIHLKKENNGYKWTEILSKDGSIVSSLPLWIK